MSVMSKVAIAVDIIDWPRIEMLVNNITEAHEIYDRTTPDNTYRCIYWDDICWGTSAAQALESSLRSFRHAFIAISEEGKIIVDNDIEDDRGIDEELEELLSWTADICFWDAGVPLTPVHPYSRALGHYMPISRERAIQILSGYVDNDLQATETGYIYDALTCAGASHEEIEALGFGYCIPDPVKSRCRDCAYLAEGESSEWICTDWEKEIHEVPDEDCAAETSHIWTDKAVSAPESPVHMDCCSMPVQE